MKTLTPSKRRNALFCLTEDLDDWLTEHARSRRMPKSAVIRQLITEYRARLVGAKPVKSAVSATIDKAAADRAAKRAAERAMGGM